MVVPIPIVLVVMIKDIIGKIVKPEVGTWI